MSGKPWWDQKITPKLPRCKISGGVCSYEKCPRAGSLSLWIREVYEKCGARKNEKI